MKSRPQKLLCCSSSCFRPWGVWITGITVGSKMPPPSLACLQTLWNYFLLIQNKKQSCCINQLTSLSTTEEEKWFSHDFTTSRPTFCSKSASQTFLDNNMKKSEEHVQLDLACKYIGLRNLLFEKFPCKAAIMVNLLPGANDDRLSWSVGTDSEEPNPHVTLSLQSDAKQAHWVTYNFLLSPQPAEACGGDVAYFNKVPVLSDFKKETD